MMTQLATLAARLDLFEEFRALVELSHLGKADRDEKRRPYVRSSTARREPREIPCNFILIDSVLR